MEHIPAEQPSAPAEQPRIPAERGPVSNMQGCVPPEGEALSREAVYQRTILLLGEEGFARLQAAKVTVVGLGGVGGHCAEALARAGVGRLHLIDCDTVAVSNLNRQLVATFSTLGMRKTEAMASRIREVSLCRVSCADVRIDESTASTAIPADTDFLVDAIDSLSGKLALAVLARERDIPMVACMGAGNRLGLYGFAVKDVFQTAYDPLARRMRQELRKLGVERLPVVCSEERAVKTGTPTIGSLAPVTASAGLCAAGYALRKLAGIGP